MGAAVDRLMLKLVWTDAARAAALEARRAKMDDDLADEWGRREIGPMHEHFPVKSGEFTPFEHSHFLGDSAHSHGFDRGVVDWALHGSGHVH